MLTLPEIAADLRAAGLAVADANGHGPGLDSLCPRCGELLYVRGRDDGSWAMRCATGCDPSRIADELAQRRRANGTWTHEPLTSSWAPVELAGFVAGTAADEPPTVLRRSDGRALLYRGRLHAVFGEPEACKGWTTLAACAQELAIGQRVLYVDFEDTAASVVGRMLALGVQPDAILDGFAYVRPEEALTERTQADVMRVSQCVSLAVLDGVTEALALQGLDLASNSDIATWLEMLPRPLARAGAAVVTIDHVVKDRESRGRYAIGAQHKLAGVDVAYSLSVITPFGRGRDGRVKITVTKDRPGHVRGIADEGRVADVRLASLDDGRVRVAIEAPESRAGSFRPTTLMERVSQAIEETPGLSKNAIRQTVKGKNEGIDLALEILVSEGYVKADRDGAAVRHEAVRVYREDQDLAPSPQVRPDLAPANPAGPRPLAPPFKGEGRGANCEDQLDLAPPSEAA